MTMLSGCPKKYALSVTAGQQDNPGGQIQTSGVQKAIGSRGRLHSRSQQQ